MARNEDWKRTLRLYCAFERNALDLSHYLMDSININKQHPSFAEAITA